MNEHFVAFVKRDGYLVELDGRKSQPIIHDKLSDDAQFLKYAACVIRQNFMDKDPEELRFSIIAVTGSLSDAS